MSDDKEQVQEEIQEEVTTEEPSNETYSDEEIDALSDEDFLEYIDTGKVTKKPKVEEEKSSDTIKEEEPEKVQEEKEETPSIDYKGSYEAIFKPFKANGKEITPKTVDDVISLMQMGANYTKKMQVLAPMKRTIETLNKASISEQDLNYLIDLRNGDKEAIKKLLKDNNIDPLDFSTDDEEDKKYVPKNHLATDQDVEFSNIMEEIKPNIAKIRDVMDNKWDDKSRELFFKNPQLLKHLSEEFDLNRFDKVQEQVEREKMFGRYQNVSDLEAYIDIVTKMVNAQNSATPSSTNVVNKKPIPDKSKAAPTKSKPKTQTTNNLTVKDLFSMSEEDFNRLSIGNLY